MTSHSKEILTFSEDIDAAARLYLQHWMCTYETGFLVHPAIPLNNENLKVADIACGTGIWLVDLSRSVSPTAQLDGFDISSAHFPPKQWLPQNVRLNILDANGPMPEHLIGKYDIVHVGRIVLFVRDGDPSNLLRNITSLLKPGGHVYWDEVDLSTLKPQPINDGIQHSYCDKLSQFGNAWFRDNGVSTEWVDNLNKHFENAGIHVVEFKRQPISNDMAKPWTLMQLMANRDFVENDIIPSTEGKTGQPTPDQWRDMMKAVVTECLQGVKLTMDIVYIVGTK